MFSVSGTLTRQRIMTELAPGSIGFLAEHLSLGTIYLGLAALLLIPLLLSRLAATADFEPRDD